MGASPPGITGRIAAALAEVGYEYLAVVVESRGSDEWAFFRWGRLGRCPSLDEVAAIAKAYDLAAPSRNHLSAEAWHAILISPQYLDDL